MSRLTKFKHWLFNKDKRPLYVEGENILAGDINTLTKPDGQPACLEDSPRDWKNTTIKYARSNIYDGLFTEFSIPLMFTRKAAKILKNALWSLHLEAEIYYGFSILDKYSYPHYYSPAFVGQLNFSKFKQSREGFEVTVEDSGPSKYLKANESTTYEIPVGQDDQAIQVYLDGIPFNNKVEWTIYENQLIGPVSMEYELGAGIIVQEGTSQGVLVQDQSYKQLAIGDGEAYFFRSETKSLSVDVSGSIYVSLLGTAEVKFIIRKRKIEDGAITAQTDYLIIEETKAAGQYEIPIDLTIPVSQYEQLSLIADIDSADAYRIQRGNMLVEYEVTFDPTFTKAIFLSRLAEKLVEKLSDGKCSFSSEFLDSIQDVVVTCGMSLRNFTDEKAVIKINWTDFYKSLKRFGVMLGTTGDQIYIEELANAYQDDIILDLGTVSNLTIEAANDKRFNTVKTGYPNQNYDNVNGLDEFNVTQQWTTPILNNTAELDLTSPIRADMYGIELTRLALFGKDTTDSSSDNDTFFLSVEKGAVITYYSGPYVVKDTNIIVIPRVLYQVTNGTTIESEEFGSLMIANTSYLIEGHTAITVSQTLVNGEYTDTVTYSDSEIYKLKRRAYDSITGLLHPEQAFNVELSPKRALINNYRLLRSFMEDTSWLLKFQSGEKNSELSTEIDGVTITENEDIQVSDMGNPFYLPYYFSFDTEVPVNHRTVLATNPYGVIKFNDESGNVFYSRLWDGDWRPGTNERSKWKMLAHPLTDKNLLK